MNFKGSNDSFANEATAFTESGHGRSVIFSLPNKIYDTNFRLAFAFGVYLNLRRNFSLNQLEKAELLKFFCFSLNFIAVRAD